MKKSAILCTLLFSLLLTACGAPTEEEAVKETSYQVLDADEAEVCVISDQAAVEEMNELINSFTSGEATPQGEEPIKPLYTYILWQETTALAGEDPAAERELLEVMRVSVQKDSDRVLLEILPDSMEAVADLAAEWVEDAAAIRGFLSFCYDAPPETAAALRNPGGFS